MISRNIAVGLFAAGCLTAAAGGSYLAVRQNAAASEAASAVPATQAAPGLPAVTETEAVVTPDATAPPAVEPDPAAVEPAEPVRTEAPRRPRQAASRRTVERPTRDARVVTGPVAETPARETASPVSVPAAEPVAAEVVARESAPARPVEPEFDEIVVASSSVIGLEVERTITSEQARVEDRVDARVTRDVYADGRLAIPAGSRVLGTVTLVERGGKMKDRARLGVRFHTIVLADGRQLPIRTDPIYRDGDSPGAESSRKIGGAAVGGAVLGAILGGGKGAMTGAAVGAAGGTAAVMAGGRNPATLAGGSVVNVRLSAPVSVEIER